MSIMSPKRQRSHKFDSGAQYADTLASMHSLMMREDADIFRRKDQSIDKDTHKLKKLMLNLKVNKLKNLFISKLMRRNVHQPPVHFKDA